MTTYQFYSMSFKEWNVEGRLELLDKLNIQYIKNEYGDIAPKWGGLSSGERQAWNFVTDPVRPIDFAIFDCSFGKEILKMHNAFWCWKFNVGE